jgi:hypothetical protein
MGCQSKSAAENVLAELKRKAERVRSGLLTPAEAQTAERLATPIGEHVHEYVTHLEAVGTSPKHRYQTRRRLDRVLRDCRFATLGELARGAVETWLGDKLVALQAEARRNGEPIPSRLPADARLFIVPKELVEILNRDPKLAGITNTDDRGRTIDVHAPRATFGTLLRKSRVTPRTAPAATCHSDVDLTMNVYTDPRLLDVRGALDVLPALPLDSEQGASSEALRATGTDTYGRCTHAPLVALTDGKRSESVVIGDKTGALGTLTQVAGTLAVSAACVNEKSTLTMPVNVPFRAGNEIQTRDVQLGKLGDGHRPWIASPHASKRWHDGAR